MRRDLMIQVLVFSVLLVGIGNSAVMVLLFVALREEPSI